MLKSGFLARFLGVPSMVSGLGWLTYLWPPLGSQGVQGPLVATPAEWTVRALEESAPAAEHDDATTGIIAGAAPRASPPGNTLTHQVFLSDILRLSVARASRYPVFIETGGPEQWIFSGTVTSGSRWWPAAETTDSVRYAINDLFETITLWDFRTVGADAVKRPDGKYQVTIRAAARKYRSDGLGVDREIPIADLVDVGVFGKARAGELGKPLHLAKAWVRTSDPSFVVVVDEEPGQAGIDPYGKLIDRDRKDNVAPVELRRH